MQAGSAPRLGKVLGALLDPTVVLAFDRIGFGVHSLRFDPRDTDVSMAGRTCLVTGANSGLGYATTKALAERGARVIMLCRSAERGESARDELRRETGSERIELRLLDVSDLSDVRRAVRELDAERVDVLVNNAGVLPDERQLTADGLELTVATNLVGPFLLTRLLLPKLAAADGARVIHVSSGGMYLQPLGLDDWNAEQGDFDGVKAYANTKRAQVVLTELWAEKLPRPASIDVHAMHPGWADTPAVKSSLPRFHRLTSRILRTPEQGADTIVWLAVCPHPGGESGAFWFDRRRVSARIVPGTTETAEQRERLWRQCCEAARVPLELSETELSVQPA